MVNSRYQQVQSPVPEKVRKGTLKALAQELGLSITTVSRALGGFSDVAEHTRSRVREAAERLNYVPNSAGRMLVTGRSGFVALMLPMQNPVLDPFLGEFVTGLSEGLVTHDRHLFLATAPDAHSEMSVLRHVVESGRADALVLTRITETDERVAFLLERGFPFVTHGRTSEQQQDYSWIDTDGVQAFSDAFELLYALGHRRFGLISICEPMTFRSERERGLHQAIDAMHDTQVSLQSCRVPRFDLHAREAAIHAMLVSSQRPSAILALTDELALSVLGQANALHLDVPGDLSIIGFDNIPAATLTLPGLTTFDQSIRDTARDMARVLIDALDGTGPNQQRLIGAKLIERGSHGPWCST